MPPPRKVRRLRRQLREHRPTPLDSLCSLPPLLPRPRIPTIRTPKPSFPPGEGIALPPKLRLLRPMRRINPLLP
ncbi:hypothetical protein, partial [Acrocarpospora macrocephala]|uniref:hypothetical protein n=1 Tax=Acrocarpospora macrocephala TaxID=150177 RepID=UPI001C3F73A5